MRLRRCANDCEYCTLEEDNSSKCRQWKQVAQDLVSASQQVLSDWNISGGESKFTECGGIRMLGGHDVFGKGAKAVKTFNNLPAHNKMVVRLQFWKIDSWDNELAEILVDN